MNFADRLIAMIGPGYIGHPVATAFVAAREASVIETDEVPAAALRRGEEIALGAAAADFYTAARQLFGRDREQLRQRRISVCAAVTPVERRNLAPPPKASDAAGSADVPGGSTVSGTTFGEGLPLSSSRGRSQTADRAQRLVAMPEATGGSRIEALQFFPTRRSSMLGLLAGGLDLVRSVGVFQVPQAGDAT